MVLPVAAVLGRERGAGGGPTINGCKYLLDIRQTEILLYREYFVPLVYFVAYGIERVES